MDRGAKTHRAARSAPNGIGYAIPDGAIHLHTEYAVHVMNDVSVFNLIVATEVLVRPQAASMVKPHLPR